MRVRNTICECLAPHTAPYADALNDFEESDQSKPSSSQATNRYTQAHVITATPLHHRADWPSPCRSVPSTQHSEKPLGLGKGLGKGLAPRPKTKKAQPAPAATLFPGFGRGFGAVPPDIGDQDELSANFQKMMAELAHGALSHTAKLAKFSS